MRLRILYIMNVDWDWAKQRPHFLAQHLARSNDVVVVYPHAWRRRHLAVNDRAGLQLSAFFRIPLGGKFLLIRKLNERVLRLMAQTLIRSYRPDLIWVSSPELFACLPKQLPARLIYDCMDDVLAFPSNVARLDSLAEQELELVRASSYVFCSSRHLRDKLVARAGLPEKFTVIHNAYEPTAFADVIEKAEAGRLGGLRVLGYIGTLSSWLDHDALVKIVNEFPSIEIHLLGPIENPMMELPRHERIKHLGAVRHSDIQQYAGRFDALLMPFHVTELVRSVDPVKLYEYVFFNKPIISVWYEELERFADFVDFYSDHQELISIVGGYLGDGFRNRFSDDQRLQFLSKNTWEERTEQIHARLTE